MDPGLLNRRLDLIERTRSTEADLSGLNLDRLPADLLRVRDITTLILRRNHLRVLEPWLGELRSLKKLDLSDNHFETFPHAVTDLPALAELDLTKNRIEAIPAEISRLSRLKLLSLQ